MNSQNLLKLIIAATVLILGAWWLAHRNTATHDAADAALYPALKGKLADVQGIRIYGKGDQLAVEIKRDGDAFLIEQRHRHPADNGKVKTLLVNLESAKLREEKTSNPVNYSALGVQPMTDADAEGTRIELTGAAVNLVVGKRNNDAKANYVRRTDDKTSWLINVELDAPADASQWLQRNVLDVAATRIAEATVTAGGAKPYTASKAKQTDAHFDVTPIPKGRELSSISAAAPLSQTLANLQLDDVRPIAELANDKPAHRATLRTFDGLVINIAGYGSGDDNWITLSANFDAALAKRFYQADSQADAEKTDAADATFKSAQDEAEAINKRSANWAYSIPAYKFEQLFKPLEQMLKSK